MTLVLSQSVGEQTGSTIDTDVSIARENGSNDDELYPCYAALFCHRGICKVGTSCADPDPLDGMHTAC